MKRNSVSLIVALGVFAFGGIAAAQAVAAPDSAVADVGSGPMLDLRHTIEELPYPTRFGTAQD